MKTIMVPKAGLYANPVVSTPHLEVENDGDIVEVDDAMANRMCVEFGATEVEAVVEDDSSADDSGGDQNGGSDEDDDAVNTLSEANTQKALVAECKQLGLDATGNKTDLATRLVGAGVTEITTE